MSRNINKSNEIVFENIKLFYFCSDKYIEDPSFNNQRYISGDESEKEILKNLKIDKDSIVNFGNDKYLVYAMLDGTKHLISIGIEGDISLPDGLEQLKLNAGIFTAVTADFNLMVKNDISPNKISNEILSLHTEIEEYKGHDFLDLFNLFPKICDFSINEQVYAGDINSLEQMACIIFSLNKDMLSLPYRDETLDFFKNLCYKNFPSLKYENLFQALISTNFKFAFLNIYRSIEMLYQICYIVEFEKEIPGVKRETLLKSIDLVLKWKPNERSSFIKILNSVSISDRSILTKKMPNVIKETSEQHIVNNDAIWNWIYDLRCNIVHLKTFHSTFNISTKNWNIILHGLLEALIAVYGIYDKEQI